MITVEEAQKRILEAVVPSQAETVSLTKANGRVLANDIIAKRDQPSLNLSAMDGYAIKGPAKTGQSFPVSGRSEAGTPFSGNLKEGTAIRIFTGAVMPEGTTTVVLQENTTQKDGGIRIQSDTAEGANVRLAGFDFKAGDTLLEKGILLNARHLALITAAGYGTVTVYRQPSVLLIATGDELVAPGDNALPHQIYSSNTPMLKALFERAGATVLDAGIIPDNREKIVQALGQTKNADIVVTIGGASVGEKDLVQEALKSRGFALNFWRIAMKPGKPLLFGHLDNKPVLGLPGNPVSAFVTAFLFTLPLIRAMQGEANPLPSTIKAKIAHDLPAGGPRQTYTRALYNPETGTVSTLALQDSSALTSLARANCLLIQKSNTPAIAKGNNADIAII